MADASDARETPPHKIRRHPIVVGISGASCSGKSWMAEQVCALRPHLTQKIDLDGYYRNMEEVQPLEHGHDNPRSIHFERAVEDLRTLKAHQQCELPNYCYATHAVHGTQLRTATPLIILEGLFIFADARLRAEIDIKIWLESRAELRLSRRISRDTVERSRSVEEIRERYERDVVPGYQKFIEPLRQYADIIVPNNEQDREQPPLILSLLMTYLDTQLHQPVLQ